MKGFSLNQVEQLRKIADYLQQERELQGISLDEIAIKTFIPLRLLQALDEGQVERLPEPVFVQGFIRRYGDAVGLDGMTLARSFLLDQQSPEPQPSTPQPSTPQPSTPHSSTLQSSTLQSSTLQSPEPKEVATVLSPLPDPRASVVRSSRLSLGLIGLAALLVGGGAIALFNRPKLASNPQANQNQIVQSQPNENGTISTDTAPFASGGAESSPTPTLSPPATEPVTTPSPTVATSPATEASTTVAPVQIAVNLTGDKSWILVEVDGKPKFEGMLKKGDQKTWTAQKRVYLRAGNAGAVSVSYNQGEETRLGAPGEIEEATYTPEGKKASQAN